MSQHDHLPQLRYPLTDVAKILHLSRATLYERIKAGKLAIHKDGRRSFVSASELRRYVGDGN